MQIENKKYKDTVFRMLFNNKLYLLDLYNAINKTNYTNPDDLMITTLSGETFLKMKNDLSFVIDFELNIFEHQSTPSPNIPLRDLYYLAANLKDLVKQETLYGPTLVQIPTPKFYVFYNGTIAMKDEVTYRLSDMFKKKVESPSVELIVTALNINIGHNKDLMEACKALKGYSIFVTKVRKYIKEAEAEYNSSHAISLNLMADNKDIMKTLIAKAIEKSIDECIQEDILKDFFTDYRKEIIEVGVHEYSYERHMKIVQDESYNNGYGNGYNNGHTNGVQDTTALFSWLKANGRQDDILKAIDDPDYLAELFKEYEDYKKKNP
jgi:hypothetical protein